MPSLSQILETMENDCKLQFLRECEVKVVDKPRTKTTHITFETSEVNCNQFFRGDDVGIVIWVSRTKYNNAMRKLLEQESEAKNTVNNHQS